MEAEPSQRPTHVEASGDSPVVQLLERLDNLFHIIVAVLFILMAAAVLIHTCVVFARQVPIIVPRQTAANTQVSERETPTTGSSMPETTGAKSVPLVHRVGEEAHSEEVDPFLHNSLGILSSILFVVIILELLRTILTYLQTHNIQAIMQEFIVVGIISSVRKILLVGAESSLAGSKGIDFIQEAAGTLVSILGILALILGLVMLQRAFGKKEAEKAA